MINTLEVDKGIFIPKIEEMIDMPKVVRVTEFNEESMAKFEYDMNEANKTGQPVIPIRIDSFGGQVYSLIGMMSTIKQAKVPVATIVTSKAMSCGVGLFACGTEGYRFIDQNATVLIHQVSSGGQGKTEEIKNSTKNTKRLNKLMARIMSEELGKSPDFIKNLIKENNYADLYLTAKQALKYNIANHIGVPSFTTKVKLETEFNMNM